MLINGRAQLAVCLALLSFQAILITILLAFEFPRGTLTYPSSTEVGNVDIIYYTLRIKLSCIPLTVIEAKGASAKVAYNMKFKFVYMSQ